VSWESQTLFELEDIKTFHVLGGPGAFGAQVKEALSEALFKCNVDYNFF